MIYFHCCEDSTKTSYKLKALKIVIKNMQNTLVTLRNLRVIAQTVWRQLSCPVRVNYPVRFLVKKLA